MPNRLAVSRVGLLALGCGAISLLPCVPGLPIRLSLPCSAHRPGMARQGLAQCPRGASRSRANLCIIRTIFVFPRLQFYDLNSSAFLWSSGAGHADAGINSVRHGGKDRQRGAA